MTSQPDVQPGRKRSAVELDGCALQAEEATEAPAPAQHADPAEVPLDSDDSAAIVPEQDDVEGDDVTGKQRDPAVVLDEMLQALLKKLSVPHRRSVEHDAEFPRHVVLYPQQLCALPRCKLVDCLIVYMAGRTGQRRCGRQT